MAASQLGLQRAPPPARTMATQRNNVLPQWREPDMTLEALAAISGHAIELVFHAERQNTLPAGHAS